MIEQRRKPFLISQTERARCSIVTVNVLTFLAGKTQACVAHFRLALEGKLTCPRCSADLRGVQRKPGHSKEVGCVFAEDPATKEKHEKPQGVMDHLREFKKRRRRKRCLANNV